MLVWGEGTYTFTQITTHIHARTHTSNLPCCVHNQLLASPALHGPGEVTQHNEQCTLHSFCLAWERGGSKEKVCVCVCVCESVCVCVCVYECVCGGRWGGGGKGGAAEEAIINYLYHYEFE